MADMFLSQYGIAPFVSLVDKIHHTGREDVL